MLNPAARLHRENSGVRQQVGRKSLMDIDLHGNSWKETAIFGKILEVRRKLLEIFGREKRSSGFGPIAYGFADDGLLGG